MDLGQWLSEALSTSEPTSEWMSISARVTPATMTDINASVRVAKTGSATYTAQRVKLDSSSAGLWTVLASHLITVTSRIFRHQTQEFSTSRERYLPKARMSDSETSLSHYAGSDTSSRTPFDGLPGIIFAQIHVGYLLCQTSHPLLTIMTD